MKLFLYLELKLPVVKTRDDKYLHKDLDKTSHLSVVVEKKIHMRDGGDVVIEDQLVDCLFLV